MKQEGKALRVFFLSWRGGLRSLVVRGVCIAYVLVLGPTLLWPNASAWGDGDVNAYYYAQLYARRLQCGRNALFLLLNLHGVAVTPEQSAAYWARRPQDRRGTSLGALRQAAREFGMPSVVRRCSSLN